MKIDDLIYRELLDEANDPIFSFFPDGTYRYVNRAFADSIGKKTEDIIGRRIWDVFPKEEADKRYAVIKYVFETGVEKVVDVKVEDGSSVIYYLTTVKPVFDDDARVSAVICISKNITDRKVAEDKLEYYATTDELTGFVNRRTGLAILSRMHEISLRSGKPFTVCYVDIDDLKIVNDTYGHAEGDNLISVACGAMRESIRQMDTICRMGGDEFLILFPDCGLADASQVWKRVMENMAEFNLRHIKPYNLSMSHGILQYDPASRDSIEFLLRRVDELMYREKRIYKRSRAVVNNNGFFE